MITWFEFAQAIVSGLFIGAAYAVLGVGFSLTWGVTRVINLSHTVFAVLAAYITYWLLKLFGVDPIISIVITIPIFFLLGLAMHQTLIKGTAKRTKDITSASMVLTFGLILILENLMLVFFKADPRVVTASYTGKAFFIGDVAFTLTSFISLVLAVITLGAVYSFLHQTYTGKAVRAVWQDREGAMLSGIDVDRVTAITYGISLATAAIGGVCMVLMYSITPTIGFTWLVFVFLLTILGGVGSVAGAAAGGLIIGLTIGICSTFIPLSWVNLVLFVMLIIVLLAKPAGLFQR